MLQESIQSVNNANITRYYKMAFVNTVFQPVFIIMVLLVQLQSVQPDCSPVKEGNSRELTCAMSFPSTDCPYAYWALKNVEAVDIFIVCNTTYCYNPLPGVIPAVTISGSGTTFTSTLTVKADRKNRLRLSSPIYCFDCQQPISEICPGLQIYALPVDPTCSLTRFPDTADFTSLIVTCSTVKVYPEAKCQIRQIKDGGYVVDLPDIIYPPSGTIAGNPVYYNSRCNTIIAVSTLQEGTYTFEARIYPDVTDGHNLDGVVDVFTPAVTLSLAKANHTCATESKDGYFKGRSATCTCSLVPGASGYPRGQGQWYNGSTVVGITLVQQNFRSSILTVNTSDSDTEFKCDGKSSIGQNPGTKMKPKFAYLDAEALEIIPIDANICGNASGKQPAVTCRILKHNINPAPTFSFFLNGVEEVTVVNASTSGEYYAADYNLSVTDGGVYNVSCKVINMVYSDLTQMRNVILEYRMLPPSPPSIIVDGQHLVHLGQNITLSVNASDVITCEVLGGYPSATNTTLSCDSGVQDVTNISNIVTETVSNLSRDMNGTGCKCTADHVTGCYYRETSFILYIKSSSVGPVVQEGESNSDNKLMILVIASCAAAGVIVAAFVVVWYRRGSNCRKKIQTGKDAPQTDRPSSEVIQENPVYGSIVRRSGGGNLYIDYTQITPTITSATMVPTNSTTPANHEHGDCCGNYCGEQKDQTDEDITMEPELKLATTTVPGSVVVEPSFADPQGSAEDGYTSICEPTKYSLEDFNDTEYANSILLK